MVLLNKNKNSLIEILHIEMSIEISRESFCGLLKTCENREGLSFTIFLYLYSRGAKGEVGGPLPSLPLPKSAYVVIIALQTCQLAISQLRRKKLNHDGVYVYTYVIIIISNNITYYVYVYCIYIYIYCNHMFN